MIPKKIHYIWLGENPKSNFINACILTWKEHMPDYEIIEWNESNLDIEKICNENRFFKECYKRKMYAFMADYLRLKVLYENGGIYFDTDIQVLKSFDDLLDKRCILGIENENLIAAGVICAEPHNETIKKILEFYNDEIWKSPLYIIPDIITHCIDNIEDINVFPKEYFYPFYYNEKFTMNCITSNTYTIHWWSASWKEKKYTIFLNIKHIQNPIIKQIVHIKKILGYYYRKLIKRRKE